MPLAPKETYGLCCIVVNNRYVEMTVWNSTLHWAVYWGPSHSGRAFRSWWIPAKSSALQFACARSSARGTSRLARRELRCFPSIGFEAHLGGCQGYNPSGQKHLLPLRPFYALWSPKRALALTTIHLNTGNVEERARWNSFEGTSHCRPKNGVLTVEQ